MPPTRYYQLGGFRPDIRWFENDWDDKQLVGLLARPDSPLRLRDDQSLEFVLGIKHQGTSHLLLADIQTNAFERAGNRRPYRSTTVADYESISPIYFGSASELQKKLKVLKPRARKGKKEEPLDTSQANKAYVTGDHGILRGQFEHGRVLYHLLHKTINPAVYSLSDVSWVQNIRVISFLCNLRAIDSRPYDERQRAPRPLDYGWAEANVRDPQLPLKQGSATHIRRAEDRLLGTGRLNLPFEHGTTLTESQDQISLLAQQFFGEFQEERADAPTILLVYDEKLAYNALRELDVQTSSWKSGIGGLLRQEIKSESPDRRELVVGPSTRAPRHNPRNNFEQRRQQLRSRSQSPTRAVKPDPDGPIWRPLLTRRSPGPERRAFAPIYTVDVQALYRTMMQCQGGKLIGEVGQALGVLTDKNSWCAGNEAVYIFQVWQLMISGLAIDEQRASRVGQAGGTTGQDVLRQPSLTPAEESDEFDPNDIVQVSNSAQGGGGGGDDSETDYGSDY